MKTIVVKKPAVKKTIAKKPAAKATTSVKKVVKANVAKPKSVTKSSCHTRVQTAFGWQRDMQMKRNADMKKAS